MKVPTKVPKQEQTSLVVSVDKVEEKVQNTPISSVTTATVASATSMPNKTVLALRSSSPANKNKRSRVQGEGEEKKGKDKKESPQEKLMRGQEGCRRSQRNR